MNEKYKNDIKTENNINNPKLQEPIINKLYLKKYWT